MFIILTVCTFPQSKKKKKKMTFSNSLTYTDILVRELSGYRIKLYCTYFFCIMLLYK